MARKRRQASAVAEEAQVSPEALDSPDADETEDLLGMLDLDNEKEEETPEPDNPQVDAPPPEETAKTEAGTSVLVAPGKSVGTRGRGIVKAGDPVTAEDFSAGEDRIQELVAAGYLVRK